MAVAPGFIDVHTHADDVAERPLAENFLRMGVTTIVAGNCGSSAVDVGEAFDKIRTAGVSMCRSISRRSSGTTASVKP
jgi:N-acyl-D-amino-acid deacylase